jgi:hypothetical protein
MASMDADEQARLLSTGTVVAAVLVLRAAERKGSAEATPRQELAAAAMAEALMAALAVLVTVAVQAETTVVVAERVVAAVREVAVEVA